MANSRTQIRSRLFTPQNVNRLVKGFQQLSRVIKEKKENNEPLTAMDYIVTFRDLFSKEDINEIVKLFQEYAKELPKVQDATKPPDYMNKQSPTDVAINLLRAMLRTIEYRDQLPPAEDILNDLQITNEEERERFRRVYYQITKDLKERKQSRGFSLSGISSALMVPFGLWARLGVDIPWLRGGVIIIMLVVVFKLYRDAMLAIRGVRHSIADFFDSIGDFFRPSRYYTEFRLWDWRTREDRRGKRRRRVLRREDTPYSRYSRSPGQRQKQRQSLNINIGNPLSALARRAGQWMERPDRPDRPEDFADSSQYARFAVERKGF